MFKQDRIACILIVGLTAAHAWAQSAVPIDPTTVSNGHAYLFDNAGGGTLTDLAGPGINGTAVGNPQTVPGLNGEALQFDGIDDGINIPDSDFINVNGGPFENRTAIAVFKCDDVDKTGKQTIFEEGGVTRGSNIYVSEGLLYAGAWNTGEYSWSGSWLSTPIASNIWYVVAMVIRNGTEAVVNDKLEMWVNGILIGKAPGGRIHNHTDNNAIGYTRQNTKFHDGNASTAAGHYFGGSIDEIWILNEALDEGVLADTAPVKTKAVNPIPTDSAGDIWRDSILSWNASKSAQAHNVYFGMDFDEVDTATTGVSMGQTGTTFDPGILAFDQTYYWRVDEVDGAPDRTVFKGDVWRFTAEPKGLPITTITVTASGENTGMEAVNTVNGSGLNTAGEHSNTAGDMWLAMGTEVWIQYDFNQPYVLNDMQVWNSNQLIETFFGFGIKEAVIETSMDGENWTAVEETTVFAQATGATDYTANTTVDFAGALARYVKITGKSAYGTIGQMGLSEVSFSYIPVNPRELAPADGSVMGSTEVTLSWRPGRQAASHEVYLGADPNHLTLAGTSPGKSFVTDVLDYDQTVYWQVVAVNDVETPASAASAILSFTAPPYGTVDDFESYSGDEGQEIFMTWLDGYGGDTSLGGSTTGHIDGPFVETGIIHDGGNAMPFYFANDGTFVDIDGKPGSPSFSEVVREFGTPRDWTASGARSLTLFFHGVPGNTPGQLYVKINGTKVLYDGAPTDLKQGQWQPWNIDLSSMSVKNVRDLAIGVEGAGAKGVLYIDAIRLDPGDVEIYTAVVPDTANLVAYYPLDGNYQDASGNKRHGVPTGDPIFVPGFTGEALQMDGADDIVTITGYKGIGADRTDPNNPIQYPFTVACWINTTDTAGLGSLVFWGSGDGTPIGGQYQNFRVNNGRLRAEHGDGRFRGATMVNDGEWHHVAMTVDTGANMYPPGTRIYVDGVNDTEGADTLNAQNLWNITEDLDMVIGSRASSSDRFFSGWIDEVHVYDRALSPGEIAGLAGRTGTIHVPF